jgi:serine/threonine protein kinase
MAFKNKNNSIAKQPGIVQTGLKIGDTLRQGKYKIVQTIGEGGYGFVFLVEDKKDKKK